MMDNSCAPPPRISRNERQTRQRTANRARHRLLSIRHDVDTFVRPILASLQQQQDDESTTTSAPFHQYPIVANERCGSWYAYPLEAASQQKTHLSCYFKSTDGHVHQFSLKRLNLNVVKIAARHGGCFILDASVRKEIPDSFSRTIPIWAATLNRIAIRYRKELGMALPENLQEYYRLFVPDWIISKEEYDTMESLVDTRVEDLYNSKAIIDPEWLASALTKPIRPYWITPQRPDVTPNNEAVFAIVCLNCSEYHPGNIPLWKENGPDSFWYTSGAADDHEAWARHLGVPRIFWEHETKILNRASTIMVTTDDPDEQTDATIDEIVRLERAQNDSFETSYSLSEMQNLFDIIGETKIAIGSRRAGRPPECWQHFDAILNVTDTEYPDIQKSALDTHKFYLQLPVKEGKRDRSELERWLAVGIVFCMAHAQENDRRVLIHCAQGKDRSVAIMLAVVALFCDLSFPLRWSDNSRQCVWQASSTVSCDDELYQSSGLSKFLVDSLIGQKGRDKLFACIRKKMGLSLTSPFATKESLRIALHLIRQDREKADPTRSTMQKLNRFFMSQLHATVDMGKEAF